MIKAEITDDRLIVSGHAGDAPHGSSIICAAVSALTLTLEESLRKVARMDCVDLNVTKRDGYMEIRWLKLDAVGQALVDAWLIGMQNIRDNYGHIELK